MGWLLEQKWAQVEFHFEVKSFPGMSMRPLTKVKMRVADVVWGRCQRKSSQKAKV